MTDNELGTGGSYDVPPDWRRQLVRFLGGVDTLIHDGMYSEAMIEARAGWGHSTPEQAVELARDAGCRRLVLFHHEPEHDDADDRCAPASGRADHAAAQARGPRGRRRAGRHDPDSLSEVLYTMRRRSCLVYSLAGPGPVRPALASRRTPGRASRCCRSKTAAPTARTRKTSRPCSRASPAC